MTQSQVLSGWRRATPDRGPGQALGGDGAIGKARRDEAEVAADHGPRVEPEDAPIAEGEFPARGHPAGKVRPDGFRALQHPSLAAVDDGLRLINGHHFFDVSRPLSGSQQPLQILRITRWLSACIIGHSDAPLTAIRSDLRPARGRGHEQSRRQRPPRHGAASNWRQISAK